MRRAIPRVCFLSLLSLSLFSLSFHFTLSAAEKIYFNRKLERKPSDKIIASIDHELTLKNWVMLLDTRAEGNQYESQNIITGEISSKIGFRHYRDLSQSDKENFIFRPFLENLKKHLAKPLIIHIDHHYPYFVLSEVSTTVLVADFLIWLHSLERAGTDNIVDIKAVVEKLKNSVRILDHSDADILLAHDLMDHAGDLVYLESSEKLYKGTALFNDYLVEVLSRPSDRSAVTFFFYYMESLEDVLSKGADVHSTFQKIEKGFEFLTFFKEMSSSCEDLAQCISSASSSGWPEEFVSVRKGFISKYQRYLDTVLIIQELVERSQGDQFEISSINGLMPRKISKYKNTLIVYIDRSIEGSLVTLILQRLFPHFLRGIDLVVTISQSQTTTVKGRVVGESFDLGPAYPALRSVGIQAGGRAKAGTLAYGFEGRRALSAEELRKDLDLIYRIIEKNCPSSLKTFVKSELLPAK